MFTDIGSKIKNLVKIVTVIGIVISCLIGLVVCLGFISVGQPLFAIFGIGYAAVSSLLVWISSFLIYGFGELVESNTEILDQLRVLMIEKKTS